MQISKPQAWLVTAPAVVSSKHGICTPATIEADTVHHVASHTHDGMFTSGSRCSRRSTKPAVGGSSSRRYRTQRYSPSSSSMRAQKRTDAACLVRLHSAVAMADG